MSNQPALETSAGSRRKQRHELRKPIPVIDTLSGESVGALANITVEGMLIICNRPMDANRIYQIALNLPESINGHESVGVGIDCLWVKQGESQDLNWAGCEIIDADQDAIDIIEILIRDYSTDCSES